MTQELTRTNGRNLALPETTPSQLPEPLGDESSPDMLRNVLAVLQAKSVSPDKWIEAISLGGEAEWTETIRITKES